MFARGPIPRFIQALLLANAAMFLAANASGGAIIQYLGLIPARLHYMPWMLFTNMFLHMGFWHLFANMFFGVYMFGSYLEGIIGQKRFIRTYFLGGLAAAVFYSAISLTIGIPDPRQPAIGASGAVFAVIGALVTLRPNMIIYLNLFFPMKLWVFAGLYMAYSIFAFPSSAGGVAHSAHLGGLLIGLWMGKKYKSSLERPVYTQIRYY